MLTLEQLDAEYGQPPGTGRSWARAGVIGADPSEHEYVAALLERPALAAGPDLTVARWAEHRAEIHAAHAARVRASLDRAAEAACPESPDPARAAAG